MKKIISLSLLITLCFLGCKKETKPEVVTVNTTAAEKTLDPNANYAKAEFNIEGMTCAIGCAKTIEKNLSAMDGVNLLR